MWWLKLNKECIHEFMHFVGGIVPNYDKMIFVRDFDIHACCPFFYPVRPALCQRD